MLAFKFNLLRDYVFERVVVFCAFYAFAHGCFGYLVFCYAEFLHDWFHALPRHNPRFIANVHLGILSLWMHRKHSISDNREGHGGPHEEKLVLAVCHLEFEVKRWVFYFFVGAFVAHFSAAKRSLASWAIRHYIM